MANEVITTALKKAGELSEKFLKYLSIPDVQRFFDENRKLGETERFRLLDYYEGYYRCLQHQRKEINWDGTTCPKSITDLYGMYEAKVAPPGFYTYEISEIPWYMRRPFIQYRLGKVIVERFTSLLFSETKAPKLQSEDENTQRFLNEFVKKTQLWRKMALARNYGGAMGTVIIGFHFENANPVIEVINPKFCSPKWKNRERLELEALEILYKYVKEEPILEGKVMVWRPITRYYRRIIDENFDILYNNPIVSKDKPIIWEIVSQVEHGFGFVPFEWIQNIEVLNDIDGDPDLHGLFDDLDALDALLSQAHTGTLYNSDPTLVIKTNLDFGSLKKGSRHALKVNPGDSVDYLELSGQGPKIAIELAERLRSYILETAQCVLEHPNVAGRTATEIERIYASMFAKADELRMQYGNAILRLIEKVIKAVRILSQKELAVNLPELGEDEEFDLIWKPYFEPTPMDEKIIIDKIITAKAGKLISRKTAMKNIAPYFNIKNIEEEITEIEAEEERDMIAFDEMMTKRMEVKE